jgi:hypothetical protein
LVRKGRKWEDLRGIGKEKGEIEEVGMGEAEKGRKRRRGEEGTLQTITLLHFETPGFDLDFNLSHTESCGLLLLLLC